MTDNNNLDDLEHHDLEHEHEETTRVGLRANLVHAWRSQPLIKLLALMVVVAAVVGVSLSLFSGGPERKNTTSIGAPPSLHEAPGGKASEYVKEETRLANEQREKDALKAGTSSMPTPIGGDADAKRDDPMNELRAEIENLTKEVNKPKPAPVAVQQQPQQQVQQQPEQFDEGLAHAMQKQMGELAGAWSAHGIKTIGVSKGVAGLPASAGRGIPGLPGADGVGTAANGATDAAKSPASKILIPAGTIAYAKLLTQANSDVPGPILAEIVSGPLTGARAIGNFSVENSYSDYLVLRFTLAELKGKEYQINTLAIDPDTSLGALATDVDERYFERVFLPAAAAFIQGVGQALSTPSSSTSTNGDTTIVSQAGHGLDQGLFSGASNAAQTVGQFFQNQANNTKPLIVVAAGTPMGLLFVTSLKDQPPPSLGQTIGRNIGQAVSSGMAGYSASDASLGGASASAYPGSTVAGYGGATPANVPYQPMVSNTASSNYNPGQYSSFLPGYNATVPNTTVIAPH